ncbi:hypothetical protein HAX54_030340, partial [Datura stramonium]|nr:hypothetical protein [Datura stramonium]
QPTTTSINSLAFTPPGRNNGLSRYADAGPPSIPHSRRKTNGGFRPSIAPFSLFRSFSSSPRPTKRPSPLLLSPHQRNNNQKNPTGHLSTSSPLEVAYHHPLETMQIPATVSLRLDLSLLSLSSPDRRNQT